MVQKNRMWLDNMKNDVIEAQATIMTGSVFIIDVTRSLARVEPHRDQTSIAKKRTLLQPHSFSL
jgi:hypothetical protein